MSLPSFPKNKVYEFLRAHGFEKMRQHQKGVIPWQSEEHGYIEVYCNHKPRPYAWAIGPSFKDSRCYPGGQIIDYLSDLTEALS